ncbi:HAD-IA family hydrolase [Streptococcus ovuberis]|uniref:HAD-IA family hydrolase n=1 Tax=Streptococcus ovuberis TaxID=1936207 RepID=A0A7X6N141_9STRE|nr:HAD-IA family hydrolase [Streptococcus ovuberis]NKZ21116.1 HAD-IA family hydrolase [Streptococcus ovuberis]
MRYRDYIWDLGGTLLDNYEISTQAFSETLEAYGRPVPGHDEIYAALKLSTAEAIARYAADIPDFLNRYKENEAIDLQRPILFSGAKETLETITAEGGRHFLWSHRDNQVLAILERAGIISYFEEIVTADQGFPRKPDPKALFYLKDKYQMTDALVIGDREIDIRAGQAAGMATYLVDGNHCLKQILDLDKAEEVGMI